MYWPCNLSAARRSADSRNVRPRRSGSLRPPAAGASSAGPSRTSERMMEASDLRISRISRPMDRRRCFGTKLASP